MSASTLGDCTAAGATTLGTGWIGFADFSAGGAGAGGGGAGFGAGGVMGAFGLRDAAPEGGVVHNSAVNGGLSEFSKCQGRT